MIGVAIAGAGGRMGRALVEAVRDDPALHLSGALGRKGSPHLGQDATAFLGQRSGIVITDDVQQALSGASVLVDFTVPQSLTHHLEQCVAGGIAMVIGTTGLSPGDDAAIRAAATHIGIVQSSNMSVGINVVYKLLEVAATALDESFDVEILEAHHRHKRDAPSGTALAMGQVIAAARATLPSPQAASATPAVRQPGSIGFASVRGGDIVGDHTVFFAGAGERIEVTHRSSSRATYAQGSVRAVHFLAGAPKALYTMRDVLGLR